MIGAICRKIHRRATLAGALDALRLTVVPMESRPLVIGAILVVFVLFFPKGIWGTLTGGFHGR
jgi:ABC-type branched-subunit amino acid transport system permease subunit